MWTRQVQKLGRGANAIQAGGNIRVEITDAQVALLADSLWDSLGGNQAEVTASLLRARHNINTANEVSAVRAEAAFRNMVTSWCDTRLRQANVQSFFEAVSSMHDETADRKEYNNKIAIYSDTCVLVHWLRGVHLNNIQDADPMISRYLMENMANEGSIRLLPSVATELQSVILSIIQKQALGESGIGLIGRIEKLLHANSPLKFQVAPSPPFMQSSSINAYIHQVRRNYPGRKPPLHSTSDAFSIASIIALNEAADAPRSVLVTVDHDLLNGSKRMSQHASFHDTDRLIRHVYGAAWGVFYQDNRAGSNIDYLTLISKAVALSGQYLSSLRNESRKPNLDNLRVLHKAIEDVAHFVERFHRDTERRIRVSNERAADSLLQFTRRLEDGSHILRELVAFFIHQLENWPTSPVPCQNERPLDEA